MARINAKTTDSHRENTALAGSRLRENTAAGIIAVNTTIATRRKIIISINSRQTPTMISPTKNGTMAMPGFSVFVAICHWA
ncbi:hypothetical protein ACFFX0_29095 [Citricoccus parietis]|uniref:Uncharacterized protein n=1 Tax=Citricoccus parietis TaxID=592307 RepID=A0ABV5G7W2_9MICC